MVALHIISVVLLLEVVKTEGRLPEVDAIKDELQCGISQALEDWALNLIASPSESKDLQKLIASILVTDQKYYGSTESVEIDPIIGEF